MTQIRPFVFVGGQAVSSNLEQCSRLLAASPTVGNLVGGCKDSERVRENEGLLLAPNIMIQISGESSQCVSEEECQLFRLR